MLKHFVTLMITLFLLFGVSFAVSAEETNDESDNLLKKQSAEMDFSEIETFIKQIDSEAGNYLPEINVETLLANIQQGKIGLDFKELGNGLLKYLFHELLFNSALLGELIILGVIAAVLQNLQSAFADKGVSSLAYTFVYLVLLVLALNSFRMAAETATGAIEQMVGFIQAILPLISTLMVATGSFTSAAMLHPLVFGAASIISTIFKDIVFPLIFFSIILDLISLIIKEFQVSRLADFFKKIGTWLMGLSMMIFLFILGLQGVAGAVSDGVAMRTAKFAAGTFIPVAGKFLSDALEVVVGTSLLFKNALGILTVIVIIFIAFFPAIKILVLVFLYNLASALIQPFGEERLSQALGKMSSSLALIFGSVAGVGLMFFMAIITIIWLSDFSVMLR